MKHGKLIYMYDDGTLYHHKYRDRYMGPSGKWVYVYDDGSMSSKVSTKKINKQIPKPLMPYPTGEKMKALSSKKKKKDKKQDYIIREKDAPSGLGGGGSHGGGSGGGKKLQIDISGTEKANRRKKQNIPKAAPIFVQKGNLMGGERPLIRAKEGVNNPNKMRLKRKIKPEPKSASEMVFSRLLEKRKKNKK